MSNKQTLSVKQVSALFELDVQFGERFFMEQGALSCIVNAKIEKHDTDAARVVAQLVSRGALEERGRKLEITEIGHRHLIQLEKLAERVLSNQYDGEPQ